MEPLMIGDSPYLGLGADLDEIGRVRLGKLVRLVAVEPDGRVTVLSNSVWSRHPDCPPGVGDDGSALRTLCAAHAKKHPGAVYAVRVIR